MKPLLWALLCLSQSLLAEQKQQFDDYQVHYNAFNSSFISADTARQVRIQRSGQLGLINISVQDLNAQPLTALVQGEVSNQIGQIQTLDFQRIEEAGARYYLASFKISGEDRYQFRLKIQAGSRPVQALQFHQKLVAD